MATLNSTKFADMTSPTPPPTLSLSTSKKVGIKAKKNLNFFKTRHTRGRLKINDSQINSKNRKNAFLICPSQFNAKKFVLILMIFPNLFKYKKQEPILKINLVFTDLDSLFIDLIISN